MIAFPFGNKWVDFSSHLRYYSRKGMKLEVEMTTKAIGKAVQARRKQLRLNQAELAMVSGTGVRFISDLENGKESCELGKALKVLTNLGIRLDLINQGGV
jgi:HTH-type transcriptional regulator / antitoxin HipB